MTATDESAMIEANRKRAQELNMPEPFMRPGGLPAQEPKPTSQEEAEFLEKVKRAQYKKITQRQQLADKEFHDINHKRYYPIQITAKQHEDLDQLRADWQALKTKDAHKAGKRYNAIYKTAAEYFLGMTEAEYYACKFVEIKAIIDALSERTEYGSFL